jgi:hypothetical protein
MRKKINYQCYKDGQQPRAGARPLRVYHSTAEYSIELFEKTGKLFPCKVGPEFIAKDSQSVDQLIGIMGYEVVDIRVVVEYLDAPEFSDAFDPKQN